jgi:ABC-type glutathione transport system ATPase component
VCKRRALLEQCTYLLLQFHLAYRSDLILFLEDGQLKEKGRHHDLMKIDGKYKEMYLMTTNVSGKEIACQTVAEGEEHTEVVKSANAEKEEVVKPKGVNTEEVVEDKAGEDEGF